LFVVAVVVFKESGKVYAFGDNTWGQLGLGHCRPVRKPVRIKGTYTYYLLVMVMEWKWTYIVPLLWYLTFKALRYRSHSFTCKLHRICLYLVSIHQMAPPQTEVADI